MIRQDMRATELGSKSAPIVQRRPRKPRERLSWLLEFANRAGSIRDLPDEELQLLRLQLWEFCERMMICGGPDDLSAARLAKLSGEIGAWYSGVSPARTVEPPDSRNDAVSRSEKRPNYEAVHCRAP
jgi:hypothetical protein